MKALEEKKELGVGRWLPTEEAMNLLDRTVKRLDKVLVNSWIFRWPRKRAYTSPHLEHEDALMEL